MGQENICCITWDATDVTNSSPILEISINMVKVVLLIDTGASLSFIDRTFVEKNKLLKLFEVKRRKSYIVNIHGGETKIDSVIHTHKLTLGGRDFEHSFVIMDMDIDREHKHLTYDGIIGFDFLMKYGITLDFSKYSLILP